MPCITYIERDFSAASLSIIEQANAIIAEYMEAGFVLTVRQLYYQFVSRDLIPNTQQSYKRIGSVINDARLAGMIDWDAIEDRTRNLESQPHWKDPAEIVQVCADQFRVDKWRDQNYHVEVWIEKEALAGVIEPICNELQVAYLSCRGYTSQSEMWTAAQRLRQWDRFGQECIIIHLGDHDPSGIDMTRDIEDRLETFRCRVNVERIALNFDQIEIYQPPPNPAKTTDSRFGAYITRFGEESWELDAIDPKTLSELIRDKVAEYRDEAKWAEAVEIEERYRQRLQDAADNYDWNE